MVAGNHSSWMWWKQPSCLVSIYWGKIFKCRKMLTPVYQNSRKNTNVSYMLISMPNIHWVNQWLGGEGLNYVFSCKCLCLPESQTFHQALCTPDVWWCILVIHLWHIPIISPISNSRKHSGNLSNHSIVCEYQPGVLSIRTIFSASIHGAPAMYQPHRRLDREYSEEWDRYIVYIMSWIDEAKTGIRQDMAPGLAGEFKVLGTDSRAI